jgi:3'-phosphoadenosine 5'-phosphosulfate sulfotransferase (PAPS reductase)/FAD synthetase
MSVIHVVSVSSGKDSDATLLMALQRFPKERVRAVICDTGNEHELVWEHIAYLERRLGIKVDVLRADFTAELAAKRMFIARDQRTRRDDKGRRLRWSNKAKRRALAAMQPSGNPFLDLCMWKGRFPSRKAQFCTQELKTAMMVQYQQALVEQGHRVVSWQGVRRDESPNRRNAKKFERLNPRTYAWRPLVDWTAEQVFAFLAAFDVEPNALYRLGMGRVGCMPCINAGKVELREIAMRWPAHLQRLSDWERRVSDCSKRGFATFFVDAHPAKDRRVIFADLNVWSRIEWAKTTRGGQQYDLLSTNEEPKDCASAYGLCE